MLYEIVGSKNKEKIAKALIEKNSAISLNQLSRETGVSKSQVKYILDDLMESGVAIRSKKGYVADKGNLIVKYLGKIYSMAGEAMSKIASQLKKLDISVALIGSTARHAKTPKDIDFLIVCKEKDKAIVRKACQQIRDSTEHEYSLPIDIIILTISEFNKLKKSRTPFYANIVADSEILNDPAGVFDWIS